MHVMATVIEEFLLPVSYLPVGLAERKLGLFFGGGVAALIAAVCGLWGGLGHSAFSFGSRCPKPHRIRENRARARE
jgi:hypothetical protein